jgi:hypothetical protein
VPVPWLAVRVNATISESSWGAFVCLCSSACVREPARVLLGSPSRGELVRQCLQDGHPAQDQAVLLALGADARNGFYLL